MTGNMLDNTVIFFGRFTRLVLVKVTVLSVSTLYLDTGVNA
jgi:hypothetical protein